MAKQCATCESDLPAMDGARMYPYRYCPNCREQYGRYLRNGIVGPKEDFGFPLKGRDRVAEKLRDGFAMLRDDGDQEAT